MSGFVSHYIPDYAETPDLLFWLTGDVVVVTPGTQHNFRNTGTVPMQITTTYAPPNHIDGRIQHTKADADADVQDEAFGEAQ